jgi:hypothetical protein
MQILRKANDYENVYKIILNKYDNLHHNFNSIFSVKISVSKYASLSMYKLENYTRLKRQY